ncbi:MAG: hypothetical protein U0325_34805 [Polyangiales bacterium]
MRRGELLDVAGAGLVDQQVEEPLALELRRLHHLGLQRLVSLLRPSASFSGDTFAPK